MPQRGGEETQRALLKDPIAFFSAPWLANTFDADVLLLVRHPAAFASSLKRLGWGFDFRNLTSQQELMDGPLAAHADELRAAEAADLDIIDVAIVLWRVFNSVALTYRADHPTWLVRRYEDLAGNPVEAFRALYSDLGLSSVR